MLKETKIQVEPIGEKTFSYHHDRNGLKISDVLNTYPRQISFPVWNLFKFIYAKNGVCKLECESIPVYYSVALLEIYVQKMFGYFGGKGNCMTFLHQLICVFDVGVLDIDTCSTDIMDEMHLQDCVAVHHKYISFYRENKLAYLYYKKTGRFPLWHHIESIDINPNIYDWTDPVFGVVFKYLSNRDRVRFGMVCRKWNWAYQRYLSYARKRVGLCESYSKFKLYENDPNFVETTYPEHRSSYFDKGTSFQCYVADKRTYRMDVQFMINEKPIWYDAQIRVARSDISVAILVAARNKIDIRSVRMNDMVRICNALCELVLIPLYSKHREKNVEKLLRAYAL